MNDKCVICGSKVVLRSCDDLRIEKDGTKCFDHIGVPRKKHENSNRL